MHYTDNPENAKTDTMLQASIQQGYVPGGCLLSGMVVFAETMAGRDACHGCNLDRVQCGGRPRRAPRE